MENFQDQELETNFFLLSYQFNPACYMSNFYANFNLFYLNKVKNLKWQIGFKGVTES